MTDVRAYRWSCVEAHRRALAWTLEHLAWCRAEGHDRHAASASLRAREHARQVAAARRLARAPIPDEALALF